MSVDGLDPDPAVVVETEGVVFGAWLTRGEHLVNVDVSWLR